MFLDNTNTMIILIFVLLSLVVGKTKPCDKTEFSCGNGECIGANKYCNGLEECTDGTDEIPNCTPCNRTYFGEIGRTYELEVKRPLEEKMPLLCFLNFTAGTGSELVQVIFESFSVGTFESFTSDGCPDGFVSIRENNRPNQGGKWCGSAWGYTVYYSETNSINLTLFLERFPQQQNSGYSFEFKLSYKFLKVSDARIRYGNGSQRSYRGKLSTGSYCDRLLEGCSRRPCRIQSPNYPGIYPRNVSCHYKIRERNVPQDKHALIAIRQGNYHHKEHVLTKYDNNGRGIRIWDQCSMMQDYIEILDGFGPTATSLAHLCSGEIIPEIISSGSELVVHFQTSPYGNPFHPLPMSYIPGFELEVEIFFVKKESPTYIAHGKKCEFVVTTFDNTSGLLASPRHSLPPNTTCHYLFKGHPKEIIWISFIKYHVNNDRLTNINSAECDVNLQIWDGDLKSPSTVPLIGQFCKDDKPKLCDHSLLENSSRITRPCELTESYISTGPHLTISYTMKYGSILYPVSFVLRYEFVDLTQEGAQIAKSQCDRTFKEVSGRFSSPKIPFLYGRGGQEDLTCSYHFESDSYQRLKMTFLKAGFGDKKCVSVFNPELGVWICSLKSQGFGSAHVKIYEYPWSGVEMQRDCFCANLTEPLTITTKTASKVVVKFSVTSMKMTEDYKNYFFEANYEYVSTTSDCVNPWKSRRLRGSSGEITIQNNVHILNHNERTYRKNHSLSYCLQQPWLIEPEDALSNFIYLNIRGVNKRDSRLCPSKNRVLVYPAGRIEDVKVICPHYENVDDAVEIFSEGWNFYSYRRVENENARSFVIEFVQKEMGDFAVTWLEVSKNPALMLPSTMLIISPPDCPYSCPELGACISPDLWCDGLRHCPSGNDEQESNCSIPGAFPITYLHSVALTIILVMITIVVAITYLFFRHWRREQKNVIVSVTEHTFLEFKNGLC